MRRAQVQDVLIAEILMEKSPQDQKLKDKAKKGIRKYQKS
jgi:hypothetical protein